MPKNEKSALGRALVKHHNHMVQEAKDKSRFYRNRHKKVLESVTEVSDIDAIMERAEESERLAFSLDHPAIDTPINLDENSSISNLTPEEREELQKNEEELHAGSLRVPRRPPWNAKMSVEELDANEKQSFLDWRRSLARLEENENLVLTPFEKNLDIWRQLWRVVERSDLLVMVVDARDPLFYRCPDLEVYAREVDEHKRTLLLINKADLLPFPIRQQWAHYFHHYGILFVFWSAKAASAALEGKDYSALMEAQIMQGSDDSDVKVHGRDELLARLQSEAQDIVMRRKSDSGSSGSYQAHKTLAGNQETKSVTVGFVGYPNVGKSSTINALVGEKRTGVTSTPGKTKHFQTLIISEELTLCDCPGLVFPSFSSSRYEMIASGVLPIDRMTQHREAVQVVANRVKRHDIESVYNISLPKPKSYEPQSRPPLASELLRVYCASRGYVASSGLPDETKAARQILRDYIDGKLPHFELPPGYLQEEAQLNCVATAPGSHDSGVLDTEVPQDMEGEGADIFQHAIDDLKSFELENGMNSSKVSGKKKQPRASHKQHRKPQKKKDRSWRVSNNDGDGMPIVGVFQKQVNKGPVKVG